MAGGVVIVGAGQAGFQVASTLRELGYQDDVTLIGEEPHAPYNRPPLSKAFIAGSASPETLAFKRHGHFASKGIDLRLGETVSTIDRPARRIACDGGASLSYDALILATGTRNRVLPVPGAEAVGVHTLRGIDDALRLRSALRSARRVAIVGGGFIGLEVAALLRKSDVAVAVFEAQDRLCARACLPETSAALDAHHRALGVDLRLATAISAIRTREDRAVGVELPDGSHVPADLVLICVGVVANAEIAAAAGLEVTDGIVVDAGLRTADPAILAIGDCARFSCPHHGADIRLESVPNAVEQARHVAATLTGHDPGPFRAVPWFWSDQGSLKLQMAGVPSLADTVEIVPRGAGQTAFAWRDDRLVGVECIGAPVDFVQARRLLSAGLPPLRSDVVGVGHDLRSLAA